MTPWAPDSAEAQSVDDALQSVAKLSEGVEAAMDEALEAILTPRGQTPGFN